MYLIDGHNLIPHVAGLSLRDPDDERRLAEGLAAFCRRARCRAEVYFDGAPPTQARRFTLGRVTVVFVRRGRTADAAIHARLRQLGGAARNVIVVSSDRQVQAAVKSYGAQVMDAATFARRLAASATASAGEAEEKPAEVSPDEVEEWLRLFGEEEG
ncbi:MAG TPA: NYN domain-containing protein [Anaerolineae bacterium]|nr:NYN domain-containing protein [Anaerolineae bacterium]HID84830.1 hypothetical protein [Anaerolineales bacterium]HIQ09001.1 hypothetical protein [Anaerolineaceae bacterium]